MTATSQAKQAVREQIWSQLERAGAVEPGVRGYIPAFEGADEAAERLANLPVWQQAQILEVVPDRAQLPVRIRALKDRKLVYMPAPKLAMADPFYLLDPRDLPVPATEAADRMVAARTAPSVSINEMQAIDLIVCGSVAVNERGARLTGGGGPAARAHDGDPQAGRVAQVVGRSGVRAATSSLRLAVEIPEGEPAATALAYAVSSRRSAFWSA
jgi:5-formyltetrahydrofolate cyclo-ligase